MRRGAVLATKSITIEINGDAKDFTVSVKDAEDALGDLEGASESTGKGFSGMGEKLKGFALTAGAVFAGTALLDGAKALGSKLVDAFSEAMDVEAGRDRLAAQLGLSPEQSAEMGRIAGSLYSQAYGESLGDVNEALRAVSANIAEGVGTAGLEKVTAQAMDLANAFGEDVAPMARAAGIMVKNGLVNEASEAFDVLTAGFQNGANAGEDLLDTFSEYSPLFADLGIDATKAMGMISQAMRAGARDSDFVADAIKEFAIRSKDGSDTSRAAFQRLGLDANKMFQVFAKGGPEADAAMNDVLARLNAMKDPLAQNTTATDLFGTKAEDLAGALYALDPSTAVAALGEVGGAADRLGQTLNDNALTKIEAFKRGLQQGLVTFMAEEVLPRVVELAERLAAAVGPVLDNLRVTWETFTAALRGEGEAEGWMKPLVDNILKVRDAFVEFKPQLEGFYNDVLVNLMAAWPTLRDGLVAFYENALVPFFNFVGENAEQLKNFAVVLGIVALVITGTLLLAFTSMVFAIGVVVAAGVGLVIIWMRVIQVAWDVFNNTRDALGGVIDWFENLIQVGWDLAQNIGSAIADAIRWAWGLYEAVQGAVRSIGAKVGEAIGFFAGLPGRIREAVGDLGGLLVGAGRALLDGLVRGFQNALGWAKDRISGGLSSIRNLFPFSPAKEGPFSGRGYTTYSGEAMAMDFAKGMLGTQRRVRAAATSLAATARAPLSTGDSGAGPSGASQPIHLHFQYGLVGDEDAIGRAVMRAAAEAQRRGFRAPAVV